MRRRRPVLASPNFGPFFSTDAGGRPNHATQGLGQSEGVPAINIPGLEDFVQTAAGMQIPTVGVFTPWGKLTPAPTPFGYRVVPLSTEPDTNLLVFEMGEVADLLASLGFGRPGFLALLSEQPIRPDEVARALEGTSYTRFDPGLAVYSQSDKTGVPKMLFVYWASLRDPGDPAGGSNSMSVAAQSLGAELVFAQQVPRDATDQRAPPGLTARMAAEQQFPTIFPPGPVPGMEAGPPPPPPPDEAAVPEEAGAVRADLVPPLVAGIGAGILGLLIGRSLGGGRRR